MPETLSHASSTSTPRTGTPEPGTADPTGPGACSGGGDTPGAQSAPAESADAGAPARCASSFRATAPLDALPRPRGAGSAGAQQHVHNRIGVGLAGGFYPAPHRYQLYLSPDCPRSLRVAVTVDLLGLGDFVATLPASPGAPGGPDCSASLRRAYEATWHHYDGPLAVPALCDRWTGRVVSNHTPDILRDLAGLADRTGAQAPALRPPALAADIDALRELLDTEVTPDARPGRRSAALDRLNGQLASAPYVLGHEMSAADVDLWAALVHLDAPGALAPYGHLRGYVRRLGAHPAFRGKTSRSEGAGVAPLRRR
ncbi:glutathione S-transferase C-terminal domain-containing protein [Streptomyces sp. NPDC086783]|uniref:glutathione S-transferase C-terminal domain-containing protein n=1 Tax=Streptomyces sp. NPDC086783 TaxID=3365758 RepID=UPI0037F6B9A8